MNSLQLHVLSPSISKKDLYIREEAFRHGIALSIIYKRILKFYISKRKKHKVAS